MKRFVCCMIVSMALACLLLILEPANATTEDPQPVTSVQFRSKANNLELCTGYQVFPNLFVTEARCLTGQNGKINDFSEVDFIEDGLQTVEIFTMRRSGMNSSVDSVLFLKSLVRFARDDEEAGAGVTDKPVNKTSGAGTLLGNGFMIATVLMLGVKPDLHRETAAILRCAAMTDGKNFRSKYADFPASIYNELRWLL